MAKFSGLNTQVLGISIDHIPCLKAWADSMGGVTFPLLSDFWPHGAVAMKYGVLRDEGYTERALFIVDKDGIIRYVDIHEFDDQPKNSDLFNILRQIDPNTVGPEDQTPHEPSPPLPSGGIVIYCTSWCPACRRAREWLAQNGLAYTEVDINANPAAAAQVRLWANGNETTPTFDVDGEIVVDYDLDKLKRILKDRLPDQ